MNAKETLTKTMAISSIAAIIEKLKKDAVGKVVVEQSLDDR